MTAEYGGRILVEDLPRTCLGRDSAEILRLIKDDDRLAVCFDTNHLLTEDPTAFVRTVGDRIVSLHVSDYDFVNERHLLPGEGDVDWQALVTALREVGYNGSWLYEVNFGNTPIITRQRDLTAADFVENARQIMAGEKPTVLVKPVSE